jgi:hypothetical protein
MQRQRFNFDVTIIPKSLSWKPLLPGLMLGLCLLSNLQSTLAAPLAILTDVSGKVQVLRRGKPLPSKNGSLLEAGDVVRVTRGSATVYYVSRPPQKLKSQQQVQVAAANAPQAKPSLLSNVYSGIKSGFARRPQQRTGTVRNPFVRLMLPLNSRVMTAHPTFSWARVYEASDVDLAKLDYLLMIHNENNQMVWQGNTKELSLAYPADAPALEPGKQYFWNVEPRIEKELWREVPLAFRFWPSIVVAPAAEIQTAQQEQDELRDATKRATDAQRRFFAASALDKRGFYHDAILQLVPEMALPHAITQNQSHIILDTVVPRLDWPSRQLLRGLWYATSQNDLAQKLLPEPAAPKSAEPAANEKPAANTKAKSTRSVKPTL